jgi:hypothetical protein
MVLSPPLPPPPLPPPPLPPPLDACSSVPDDADADVDRVSGDSGANLPLARLPPPPACGDRDRAAAA